MDIRKEFLEFFKNKGHKIVPSSPLVPDDASLLFTNAGMVQFKPIFTGEIPSPTPPRATSSQLCLRAGGKHNDLENVGYTARHHTLFEMLGNFSFGDYFKEDAIKFAWEFITEVVKLPKEKLWITIHDSDDEAGEIWKKYVPSEKIIKMGDKDNFWQMGDTGPCGPCSEIHFDQGEKNFNSEEDYLGGEGDRFLEIWNLVFMQYNRDEKGVLHPLPKPSIDTGMGLERIVAIKEGVFSNYDSSIFRPLLNKIEEITGKKYYKDEKGASHRVIADHIRATTFLLAQGVNFDREGRGYVLRRILRRAVRHGYLLGERKPFMYKIVDTLVDEMGEQYPYLVEKKEIVKENIKLEEERFFATIDKGMAIFEEELKNTKDNLFSGEVAFKLYDTYGFPLDLTQDMLRSVHKNVDLDMFQHLMHEQKARAKAAWKGSGDSAGANVKNLIEKFGENKFVGYENLTYKSQILALLDEDFNEVEELNGDGWVMLKETPFYAESGGQIGDKGTISGYEVDDTKKFSGLNLSQVKNATLKVGDIVEAIVDNSRKEIAKHHSATHLLHSACRIVLGEHIAQAGSLVETDKLRFDVSHPKAITNEELERIENIVNEMIANSIAGITEELPIEEAQKKGAMALFGEKYGDIVRVVSFGEASVEFCGGTHIKNTAEIGSFYITKESGVSAGVRRIEAVAGISAYKFAKNHINEIKNLKTELKAQNIEKAIEKLKSEIKKQKDEIKKLKSSSLKELNKNEKDGVVYIIDRVDNADLKELVDKEKNKYEKVFIFLIGEENGKVKMACGAKNVDIKAGNFIKEIAPIVNGGGGGRPDFAQAGGKDTSKIDEALKVAKEKVL